MTAARSLPAEIRRPHEDLPMSKAQQQQTTGPKAGTANVVTVTATGFSPATMNVKKGATVCWHNDDSVVHSVTFAAGTNYPATASGDIAAGGTWDHTFPDAETFEYTCDQHPEMKGKVVVS